MPIRSLSRAIFSAGVFASDKLPLFPDDLGVFALAFGFGVTFAFGVVFDLGGIFLGVCPFPIRAFNSAKLSSLPDILKFVFEEKATLVSHLV